MTNRTEGLRAEGIEVELDTSIGHIARMAVTRDGRRIETLHRAPWADGDFPADAPPHLARLSGDFLCAPFGFNDMDDTPYHGWPANAPWRSLGTEAIAGGVAARWELDRPVMGATVMKEFVLRDGHPFLYQRHTFTGGEGELPVGLHMMLGLPHGAELSFSPKLFGETPETALEPDPARGRSILAYPSSFEDITRAPLAAGGTADLTRYPFGEAHEDFVMLVEKPENRLAWGAALRREEGDVTLSLKTPSDFPMTALWVSNGGRDYFPWNGKHRGVLGMEEVRTNSLRGHRASLAPNALTDKGIPTSITLAPGRTIDLRHVIGMLSAPAGWERVVAVRETGGGLEVEGTAGAVLNLPYDAAYLTGPRG